ncbi:MAG: N-acetyl-gamma-glutamyl-phosphate reductase [Dehalococcoidia bacterium]|nr:N-acetyl-gamma-glutamyl-phosphate reductase [Dehalococcoidia bacterium]
MARIRAGIINVTGYIGIDLARILLRHPEVDLVCVTGRSAAGSRLADVFPHFSSTDVVIRPELDEPVDIAFSAMPHKASAEACEPLLARGVRVIDVSADFRLKSQAEYESWYGVQHPCPQLLETAVYGMPELHRTEIEGAQLVANPGCYPTGAILALAPALTAGAVQDDIIIDSKSGVSGAGRSLSVTTHFAECNESVSAYAIDGHRHMPEIRQELRRLSPAASELMFLPHLIPMSRGILSTCYARISDEWLGSGSNIRARLADVYREFYRAAPFVRVVPQPPATKHVYASNYCHVFPTYDERTGRLLAISAIDNLVRGGAGEAVQNMNLMFGLPETCGLEAVPVFP